MATSPISKVIQRLRMTMARHDEADLADAQLLGSFIERADEAALAALVRRHGPMVMSVCLRVTRHRQDAEDAFQATFLVLVRKAASMSSRALLANWLYGVAFNTALKAKAAARKRRLKEKQVTDMPEPAVDERHPMSDLLPLLDQELNRLPDKFRTAIVLCDLEGMTRRKAAQQLGCPEGSLSSRLSRARTMLAKRMARHGLASSGGSLAGILAPASASAKVPIGLLFKTVKNAVVFALGQPPCGIIPARIVALTEGVLKSMLLNKLKIGAAAALVIALTFHGVITLGRGARVLGQAQPPSSSQAKGKAPRSDAQPAPSPEREDQARLQGTWRLVEEKFWGEEKRESRLQLVFAKDKVEYQRATYFFDGTFKLEAKANPKTLDIVTDFFTIQCLYRLEGDKLVLAAPNGSKRPTDFNSTEGDQTKFVQTFVRVPVQKGRVDEVAAQEAKMKRSRLECGANLHRLVLAMHKYIDNHNHFPLATTTDNAGRPLLSWRVALLPYLGEKELYDQFRQAEPWDSAHNRKLLSKMPKVYASVGNPPKHDYETVYQVFVGEGCVFEAGKKIRPQDVQDGTVNTVAIVAAGETVPWTKPAELICEAGKPLPSLVGDMIKDGLVSFAMADGSVYVTRNTIDEKLLRPFILHNTGQLKDLSSLNK